MPIYDPTALAGDLELSRTYVGATAAPVLYMVDPPHPYKTPYEVWMEKTGRIIPEDISGKAVIKMGNKFERGIAELWWDDHKEEGWTEPERFEGLYRDEEYPFIGCHIDFITTNKLTGEKVLIECKNSGMDIKKWKPEAPDQYFLQCQYEMMLTGIERCILAANVANRNFVEHSIPANPTIQEGMKAAVINFWQTYVEPDIHPPLNFKDLDLLKDHMPDIVSEIMEIRDDLLPELVEYMKVSNSYAEMKKVFEEIEQQKQLCDAKLLDYLKDSRAKVVKIGECEIKRWIQNSTPIWNTQLMQIKYPDAYNECRSQGKSARYSIKIKNVITIQ